NEERRRSVFVELPWYQRIARVLELGPKYKAAAKIAGLRRAFPTAATMLMTGLPEHVAHTNGRSPDFLITSFDYDRLRAPYFRSHGRPRTSASPTTSSCWRPRFLMTRPTPRHLSPT